MRFFRRKARPDECTRLEADPPVRSNSTVRLPRYIYQPLDKPDEEFRLLRISKDALTHQPQCTLHRYRLRNCPEYTALSYTWGKPTPTHSVAVNGASLEVRQNLFDFLQAYTTEPWGIDAIGRPVFYWIDQVCINQDDLLERSDQVRIMNRIYRRAKMVLTWLGYDPQFIEAVRRLRDEGDDDTLADDTREAIYTLSFHTYFKRIWIIQEIALSTNPPLFVCGEIELDWDRARSVIGRLSQDFLFAVWATVRGDGHGLKRRTL